MQKENQAKELEEKYQKQLDFYNMFGSKKEKWNQKEEPIFAKIYVFFSSLKYYGLSKYCALAGSEWIEEWGVKPIKEIYELFSKARFEAGYKKVKDEYSMFLVIEGIQNICLDDSWNEEKYEAINNLERQLQEEGIKKLLVYIMEVFRAVLDKDGLYEKEFQLRTLFSK